MSLDGGKSINLYTAVDAAVTAAPELVCMFDHVCMWTCVCYLCAIAYIHVCPCVHAFCMVMYVYKCVCMCVPTYTLH